MNGTSFLAEESISYLGRTLQTFKREKEKRKHLPYSKWWWKRCSGIQLTAALNYVLVGFPCVCLPARYSGREIYIIVIKALTATSLSGSCIRIQVVH